MPKVKGTPRVRFTLFSTKEPLKPTYISLYFHYRGKRLKYSTGEKVCPDGWDFARQRAVSSRKYPEGTDINSALNNLEELTKRIYRDTNLGNIEPSIFSHELDIRMGYKLREEPEKPVTLFDFIEDYSNKYKAGNPTKRNTWKVFGLTLNQLQNYANEKGIRLDFQHMDADFFKDFKAWLFAAPRLYRINYAAKINKTLKMFMRAAFEAGHHTTQAYKGFKLNEVESDEIALGFDELEMLSNLDFSQSTRFDRVRDVFLVGCFTGLRFSDYNRIRPEHIVHEGGIKMLSIMTTKGRAQVKIPLYPVLDRLLEKYHFNIPTKSLQNFNEDIKEVGRLAGFTDKILIRDSPGGIIQEYEIERHLMITTHTARRSFATNMILAGVPVFLIMAILKHRTEAQTRRYARISESQAAQGFAVEIDKMRERPEAAYLFK